MIYFAPLDGQLIALCGLHAGVEPGAFSISHAVTKACSRKQAITINPARSKIRGKRQKKFDWVSFFFFFSSTNLKSIQLMMKSV